MFQLLDFMALTKAHAEVEERCYCFRLFTGYQNGNGAIYNDGISGKTFGDFCVQWRI